MFEKLTFNKDSVYPALVVSTMSSGKSTLINALVGTELLPSMNRACTSRVMAILDNDKMNNFVAYIVDRNNKYSRIDHVDKRKVIEFNKSHDIEEMIIEGEIKGVRNSKKSLLLIDTPGINNALNSSHEQITKGVLNEYKESLILYVINAQQIGTYDDSDFLDYIANKVNQNSSFNIIFVINKMDLIDPEKENVQQVVNNCCTYIKNKGFETPTIIAVSAESALIFKKVLKKVPLSEFEEENFERNFNYFKRKDFSLVDYAILGDGRNINKKIIIDGNTYNNAQIMAALENTGIPLLEREIDQRIIRISKMNAPGVFHKTS